MIAVEEYLHTRFPGVDCEYRDGEIVERALPDLLHSRAHALAGFCFAARRKELSLFPATSTRLRLREGLYLVPDVSVFWPTEPTEAVPSSPPFVVIEILSPDDRMAAVRDKLQEYRDWGIHHVWLVDPYSRRLYTCDAGLREVALLTVPELDIELGPEQIFE